MTALAPAPSPQPTVAQPPASGRAWERAGGRAAARRVAGAARRRPSRAWRRASHTAVIPRPGSADDDRLDRHPLHAVWCGGHREWTMARPSPLTIDALQFGSHAVRVVQPGFTVARENVRLSANQPTRTLAIRMQPNPAPSTPAESRGRPSARPPSGSVPTAPSTGRPTVSASTSGGTIYVDSRPRGAPCSSTGVRWARPRRGFPTSRSGRMRQARAARPPRLDDQHERGRRAGNSRDRFARTHTMKAILALENGTWYEGEAAGARRGNRRRGRLQHRDDRIPGGPHRSVRTPDRSSR